MYLKGLWKKNAVPYLFLLPWFLGVFALTIGPMISSLYLSFTQYDMLTPSKWIGTENYARMFDDPRYMQSLKVTFTYVFVSVPFKLIFALAVAMLLNKGIRALPLYRTVYYIPTLLGGSVAIAVLWRKMFGGGGVLNEFLLSVFGILAPDWVSNPKYAIYSIIALTVWQFGSSMIIFLAGLKQIPQELYEASEVDGAGRMRRFFNITIPMLSPVIFFNLVIQLITAFQAFTPAFIISGGKGGPIDSTLFYTLYLYQKGFAFFEMGYASAMAWGLLVIIAVFTAIIFGTSKYWVNYADGGK
ncbi:carbohydrate ABC transporter permease [Paenibacillus arenilitoris]|uniref:Sugar ABC transporter permease n=1 Tax=Paenibacillus arenilitoris TaxID=2772299 RepID=A0A927CIK3_9BACL|nr:sugar ABC transporter permease [Paenibacillus arenilitoris]MBD2868754.1 sugar ABC transporter permease [Paenibacillus arenilitoris]